MSNLTTILAATMEQANSEEFILDAPNTILLINSAGYQGTEKSVLQIFDNSIQNWKSYNNDQYTLDTTTNAITFTNGQLGRYRFAKTITTEPVAITKEFRVNI